MGISLAMPVSLTYKAASGGLTLLNSNPDVPSDGRLVYPLSAKRLITLSASRKVSLEE